MGPQSSISRWDVPSNPIQRAQNWSQPPGFPGTPGVPRNLQADHRPRSTGGRQTSSSFPHGFIVLSLLGSSRMVKQHGKWLWRVWKMSEECMNYVSGKLLAINQLRRVNVW